MGPFVFIFGGLKGSQLLDDLLVADDSNGAELTIFDPRWVSRSGYRVYRVECMISCS